LFEVDGLGSSRSHVVNLSIEPISAANLCGHRERQTPDRYSAARHLDPPRRHWGQNSSYRVMPELCVGRRRISDPHLGQ
jgi:hypothetical protein